MQILGNLRRFATSRLTNDNRCRILFNRFNDLLAVGIHGQTLSFLLELLLTNIAGYKPRGSSFVLFVFEMTSHYRLLPR